MRRFHCGSPHRVDSSLAVEGCRPKVLEEGEQRQVDNGIHQKYLLTRSLTSGYLVLLEPRESWRPYKEDSSLLMGELICQKMSPTPEEIGAYLLWLLKCSEM